LERNIFTSAMGVMAKANKILMDIPLHDFVSVFDEWKRRLVEPMDIV
jgi:hypothetical protein